MLLDGRPEVDGRKVQRDRGLVDVYPPANEWLPPIFEFYVWNEKEPGA
jgi:hypothetical protein